MQGWVNSAPLLASMLVLFLNRVSLTEEQPVVKFLSAFLQPEERQIVVGICAMTKKSNSKPMTQILERLCKFDYIDVVIFPEEVILEEPVENWPLCDCLISFHSKGNNILLKVLISPQLHHSNHRSDDSVSDPAGSLVWVGSFNILMRFC